MSAFEIATIIPIALFCLIFVIAFFVVFVSDTIEFFKKLFGKSFREKLTEQLTEIEQKLSDLRIETDCNYSNFDTLRVYVDELEERLKHLEKK